MISASTYQILKMLCMVFVVFFSVLIFKRRYNFVQTMAVVAVIAGLTVVTLADLNQTTEESEFGEDLNSVEEITAKEERVKIMTGVLCMIIAQLFHAGQGLFEEYILQRAGA